MTLEEEAAENTAFHLSHVLSRPMNCGRSKGSSKSAIPSCRDLTIASVAIVALLPVYLLIRLCAAIFLICLIARKMRFGGSRAFIFGTEIKQR